MSVKIYLNSDNGLVIEEANGVIYNRTQGDLSAKSENGRIEFSYSASGASFKDYAVLDVVNALGVAYGSYAAIISAISDFFVDAALAAAEQLEVDLGVEVQTRTSEDANLQNQINTVVSGYLGAIAYNESAPTPAKSGYYELSTGGVCSWIAGTPTVKVGDRVSVKYSTPSTYVYTHIPVDLTNTDLYNVTVKLPLPAGSYYTAATARAAVPTNIKKLGLKITYATASGQWTNEQFIGSNVSGWATDGNWLKLGIVEGDINNRVAALEDILSPTLQEYLILSNPGYLNKSGSYTAGSGHHSSNLITVKTGDKIYINNTTTVGTAAYMLCYYTSDGTFISGVSTFTSPLTIVSDTYIKLCSTDATYNSTTFSREYITDITDRFEIINDEITDINTKINNLPDFNYTINKNLFNINDRIFGSAINGSGDIGTYGGFELSPYINVTPSTQYTFSGFGSLQKYIRFEDSNGTNLNKTVDLTPFPKTITTPANCVRMCFTCKATGADTEPTNGQVELGATATSFEAYVTPSLTISKDDITYSTIPSIIATGATMGGEELATVDMLGDSFEPFPSGYISILVFGTSISKGVGATTGNDWVTVFNTTLNTSLGRTINITNSAQSGSLSSSMVSLVGAATLNSSKIVVLEGNINDAKLSTNGLTAAQVEANYRTMIERCITYGAIPILTTATPLDFSKSMASTNYDKIKRNVNNSIMIKLAKEYNIRLVNNGLYFSENYLLFDDGLHPNDNGHNFFANCMLSMFY